LRAQSLRTDSPPVEPAAAVLLPVELATPPAQLPAPIRAAGTIEIDLHGVRVRLRGAVDEASLRSVLQALRSAA